MIQSHIGKEIKIARILAELTQAEVTDIVGITVPYLSAIENDVCVPSDRLLRDLKEAVGWTPEIAALVQAQEEAEG